MGRFTPEDLLQYVYHETSPSKTAAIEAALENDWSLTEELNAILSGQKHLESIKLSPRDEVLRKILEHAEKDVNQLHTH